MASSALSSVCEIRSDLLDRLANAVEQLGRAKLSLRHSVDNEPLFPAPFITGQVEQLRNDCGLIRAELEYHRASHGC